MFSGRSRHATRPRSSPSIRAIWWTTTSAWFSGVSNRPLTLLVPYERGDIVSRLHAIGRVVTTDYRETGTLVTALVHPQDAQGFAEFETVHAS